MPRGGVPGLSTSNHRQAARSRMTVCPVCDRRQAAAFLWNSDLQQCERRCRFCGHVWPHPRPFYQEARRAHPAPL
jgi:hypothetical protein